MKATLKVTRILHISSVPPEDDDTLTFHVLMIRIKIGLLLRRDFVLSISCPEEELTEDYVMTALTSVPNTTLNEALKNVIEGKNPILNTTGFKTRVLGDPCDVSFKEPDRFTLDTARGLGW